MLRRRFLKRRLLRRCLGLRWVLPYLASLIRILLVLPTRSLRNHRPYRLHLAERREPLVDVHVRIVGGRALRRDAGVRPKAFVEQLADVARIILSRLAPASPCPGHS